METERTYWEDARQCHLPSAQVTGVEQVERNEITYYQLTFDKTIFYPKGGGQPCDQGYVTGNSGDRFRIEHVFESSDVTGVILHLTQDPGLQVGDMVAMTVDQSQRVNNSRYHSAGHFLERVLGSSSSRIIATKGNHQPRSAWVEFATPEKMDIDEVRSRVSEALAAGYTEATQTQIRIVNYQDLGEVLGAELPRC